MPSTGRHPLFVVCKDRRVTHHRAAKCHAAKNVYGTGSTIHEPVSDLCKNIIFLVGEWLQTRKRVDLPPKNKSERVGIVAGMLSPLSNKLCALPYSRSDFGAGGRVNNPPLRDGWWPKCARRLHICGATPRAPITFDCTNFIRPYKIGYHPCAFMLTCARDVFELYTNRYQICAKISFSL